MKNKKFKKNYLLLAILTLILFLLIILFIKLNYHKSSESDGLPSLNLWKPFEDISKQLNLSENESLIEKNKQIENPFNLQIVKSTFEEHWLSYVILLLIIILFIAWSIIIFKIYNG